MHHIKPSAAAAIVCAATGLLCTSMTVLADPSIRNAWVARYGGASSTLDNLSNSCNLCHATGGGAPWNAYGWNLRQQLHAGVELDQAFTNIEGINSDNDPTASSNLQEILASAQPGWTAGPNNTFFSDDGTLPNQMPADLVSGAYDPPMPCAGDINGDELVDVDDLLAVIAAWGPCSNPKDCPADVAPVGGNDVVDVDDLLLVIGQWGQCP